MSIKDRWVLSVILLFVLSLSSLAADTQQSAVNLKDLPYTASQAHMKAFLGKKYTEDQDQNIRLILKEKKEKPEEIENVSLPLNRKIISRESDYKDFYVVYNATTAELGFFFGCLTQIRNIKYSTHFQDTRTHRIFEEIIAPAIKAYVAEHIRRCCPYEETASIDYTHGYQAQAASGNLYFFGNHTHGYFCDTYMYFKKGYSQPPPLSAFEMLENILKHFKINNASYCIEQLKNVYKKNYPATLGQLFQFFIHPTVVADLTYLSKSGGDPCHLSSANDVVDSSEVIVPISQAMDRIQKDPFCMDFEELDGLQGRLFLRPDLIHNDEFVKVFSYHSDGKERESVPGEIFNIFQQFFTNHEFKITYLPDSAQQEKDRYFHQLNEEKFQKDTLNYFLQYPDFLNEMATDPFDLKYKKRVDFTSYNAMAVFLLKDMEAQQRMPFIALLEASFEYSQQRLVLKAFKETISPQDCPQMLNVLTKLNPKKMSMARLSELLRLFHKIPSESRLPLINFLKSETNLDEIHSDDIYGLVATLQGLTTSEYAAYMAFAKQLKRQDEDLSAKDLNDLLKTINRVPSTKWEKLRQAVEGCRDQLHNLYKVTPEGATILYILSLVVPQYGAPFKDTDYTYWQKLLKNLYNT